METASRSAAGAGPVWRLAAVAGAAWGAAAWVWRSGVGSFSQCSLTKKLPTGVWPSASGRVWQSHELMPPHWFITGMRIR